MTGVAGERARKRTCAPGSEMRQIGKGEPPGKGGLTADGKQSVGKYVPVFPSFIFPGDGCRKESDGVPANPVSP